jgi:YD repeat-containing protein
VDYQKLNPKTWPGRIYKKYTTSAGDVLARHIAVVLAPDGNPARLYAPNGELLSSTGEALTDGSGVLDVYALADVKYRVVILHPSTRARLLVEENVVASINASVAVPDLDASELKKLRDHLSQVEEGGSSIGATTFQYTDGKLTKINYPDGSKKTLAYNEQGKLNYIDTESSSGTTRKTFIRDANEKLSSIVKTTV